MKTDGRMITGCRAVCGDSSHIAVRRWEGAGMAVVRTVAGDVDADQLGPTTMHEHIFGDFTVWQKTPSRQPAWQTSPWIPTHQWT